MEKNYVEVEGELNFYIYIYILFIIYTQCYLFYSHESFME